MTDDKRHKRELKAVLDQIKDYKKRAGDTIRDSKWRLDVSLGRLAAEGISIFVVGILVGLGLWVLFSVATQFFI